MTKATCATPNLADFEIGRRLVGDFQNRRGRSAMPGPNSLGSLRMIM